MFRALFSGPEGYSTPRSPFQEAFSRARIWHDLCRERGYHNAKEGIQYARADTTAQ